MYLKMSEVVEMCSNLALIDVYAPLSTEIHTCYVDKFNFRVFFGHLTPDKNRFYAPGPPEKGLVSSDLIPGPSRTKRLPALPLPALHNHP